ncbi:hypothetical protein CHU98_g6228 [Xylaria longipes]|nr:hypothetical protein CHU98_g6228 [Xylaria longipes]
MRLLNVDTLRLESFLNEKTRPPYAIYCLTRGSQMPKSYNRLIYVSCGVQEDPDYITLDCEHNYTALDAAAIRGHLNIIKYLLNRINVVAPSFRQLKTTKALKLAVGEGHLDIARLLIETGADINETPFIWGDRTALERAAENGRLDTVQLLLERGASLEKDMRIFYYTKRPWDDKEFEIRPLPLASYKDDDGDSMRSSGDGSTDEGNISDDEVKGTADIVHQRHETNSTPPTRRNSIDPTPTEPTNLDFTNEEAAIYGLASPSTLESNGVITELQHISTMGNVVQQTALLDPLEACYEVPTVGTGHHIANISMADEYATDQMEIWRPTLDLREEVADYDMLDMDVVYGQDMSLMDLDTEWEGPFTNWEG